MVHGGDRVGLTWISVVTVWPHDPQKTWVEFHECINPGCPPDWWGDETIKTHKLAPSDPKIKSADSIFKVWPRMVAFIEGHLSCKVGVAVCWGKGCDMEHFFRVVEERHHTALFMPKGLDWFWDSITSIKNCTSCNVVQTQRSV